MVGWVVFFFFFFQAEDGIRDLTVTGVQTVLFRSARAAGAIAMGRGIIGAEVGFGLDDSTGGAAASELTQQDVSQRPRRARGSRSRVERRGQCGVSHVPPVSPRFTFDQNDSPPPAPPVSTSGSRGGGLGAGGGVDSAVCVRDSEASRGSTRSRRSPRSARPSELAPRPRPPRPRDRKSTRLNSSHSQISYAVFCLKKKKVPRRPGAQILRRLIRAPGLARHT